MASTDSLILNPAVELQTPSIHVPRFITLRLDGLFAKNLRSPLACLKRVAAGRTLGQMCSGLSVLQSKFDIKSGKNPVQCNNVSFRWARRWDLNTSYQLEREGLQWLQRNKNAINSTKMSRWLPKFFWHVMLPASKKSASFFVWRVAIISAAPNWNH